MSNHRNSSSAKLERDAKRAGSWYNGSPKQLDSQLINWLKQAGGKEFGPAKAIISPHAGYEHCGSIAASAYKEIDPSITRRVFILGPSHYARLSTVALSPAQIYKTPLGNLTVDHEIYKELYATSLFKTMSLDEDETEHSIELQLPYIYKVMEPCPEPYTIVPMMVGSISPQQEMKYGKVFSKYLAQTENVFVVSSDFCHWGRRFRYQFYEKDWGNIHQSIEKLDMLGILAIKSLKHEEFIDYLDHYKNTICGRHPIGILIAAVEYLNKKKQTVTRSHSYNIKFLNYKQSESATTMGDSSVSYAAASVKEFDFEASTEPLEDISSRFLKS